MALTDDIWLQSCRDELLDKNDKTFVLLESSQRCNTLSLQYIFIFLIPQNSVYVPALDCCCNDDNAWRCSNHCSARFDAPLRTNYNNYKALLNVQSSTTIRSHVKFVQYHIPTGQTGCLTASQVHLCLFFKLSCLNSLLFLRWESKKNILWCHVHDKENQYFIITRLNV